MGLTLIGGGIPVLFVQKCAAVALLLAGVGVLADLYIKDWLYGRERYELTRDIIDHMSAAEYKRRFLNSKFRRWVDHLYKNGR